MAKRPSRITVTIQNADGEDSEANGPLNFGPLTKLEDVQIGFCDVFINISFQRHYEFFSSVFNIIIERPSMKHY